VVSFLHKFIASRNHRKYWSAAAVIGSAIFLLNGTMAQPADENLPPNNPLPDQGPIRKDRKAGRGGPLKGYIVSFRIWRKCRPLSLMCWPGSEVVVDVVDGRSLIFRQRTVTVNNITSFRKYWDNNIISSKACPALVGDIGSTQVDQCIIGRGNIIQLPLGSNPFNFIYTVDWIEANQARSVTAPLKGDQELKDRKPL
jgi:hypothetical protein